MIVSNTSFLSLFVFISSGFGVFNIHASDNNIVKHHLTYCIDPNWKPYEAIVDGKHVGISKDFLDHFAQHTQTTFSLVETQTWEQTLEYVNQGRCDVIPMLASTTELKQVLSFSMPYFDVPNVLLTRLEDDGIPGLTAVGEKTLGIAKSYRHADYITEHYPEISVVWFDDEEAAIRSLSKGETDVIVSSLFGAYSVIKDRGLYNVSISGYADIHDALALGVVKSKQDILTAIDGSIDVLPQGKRADIYQRWFRVKPVANVTNEWLYVTFLLFLVALSLTIWLNVKRQKVIVALKEKEQELERTQALLLEKKRTVEFLTTQDELTKLNNRNFMLQKVEEEISRFNRFRSSVTLILVQLYKFTNTEHKPNSDSEPLPSDLIIHLAEIVIQKTRDVDTASRWSDDEIMILCPQTTLVSAQILAERILTEVEIQSIERFKNARIAIGIGSLNNEEDFSAWLEKTFVAVQSAKKQNTNALEIAPF